MTIQLEIKRLKIKRIKNFSKFKKVDVRYFH